MDEHDEDRERRAEDLQIARDVAQIRKDVDYILHGNGRKGVWALSDAVFGAPGKDDDGLLGQVKTLAEARAKDVNERAGGRKVLALLGTILVAISSIGAGFGWRIWQALGEIVAQLP